MEFYQLFYCAYCGIASRFVALDKYTYIDFVLEKSGNDSLPDSFLVHIDKTLSVLIVFLSFRVEK